MSQSRYRVTLRSGRMLHAGQHFRPFGLRAWRRTSAARSQDWPAACSRSALGFIQRHGSSTAHFSIQRNGCELAFHGSSRKKSIAPQTGGLSHVSFHLLQPERRRAYPPVCRLPKRWTCGASSALWCADYDATPSFSEPGSHIPNGCGDYRRTWYTKQAGAACWTSELFF